MYTVHWLPNALQRLATLWLQAGDRDVVSAAARVIDERLKRDPLGQSESREGTQRIILESPLGAYFEVDSDRRIVYVLTLYRFDKRGKDN